MGHLALYLQHIGNQLGSKSAAEEAINAWSWVHGLAGIDSLAANPLVQATLQGPKMYASTPGAEEANDAGDTARDSNRR